MFGRSMMVAAFALLAATPTAGAAFGDARILAPFPASPGFPEGVAVRDGRVYAAGAATLGTTGAGPSAVVVYDRATGATVARHDVVGEDLLNEHANASIAFAGDGRLHVLNTQLGTYRLDPNTGVQEPYAAPFPNLAPCVPVLVPPPCSPTLIDAPPIPNDIAFAPDVAMSSPTGSGVLILRPDGTQRARLGNPQGSLTDPYDGPANIAFDGAGRILLTNHAPVTGLVLREFSIVDADVGDPGAPLFTP